MRVLGVDPGLTRCGVAVVDGSSGHRARMVAVDVVRTPPGDEIELRLLAVHDAVALWIEEYRPDVVAVERVFAQHNVRSVMGTAQAAGVVMVAAARGGVRVAGHTPSEVKAAVTGSGRAGKEQVATMVARVLGLSETPGPPDASDALALALCQLWRGRGQARLLTATATATATTTATTTAGGSGRSAVGRRGGGRTVPPGR